MRLFDLTGKLGFLVVVPQTLKTQSLCFARIERRDAVTRDGPRPRARQVGRGKRPTIAVRDCQQRRLEAAIPAVRVELRGLEHGIE
jgi:hypothetical protein